MKTFTVMNGFRVSGLGLRVQVWFRTFQGSRVSGCKFTMG